ncbi:DUF1351 domain-containing protein [Clostridium sp.]|uniref:DUF1351 domain-containing protein n=1 Tax=Clostridium sp. TaxID=1506 RepID=UPI003216DB3F
MKEIVLNKQLPVISMNFEDVKTSLVDTMEKYKGIIVTEEGLKDCKATQKELAGVRNKIDTYRKDIKKEMSKPIVAFEDQCKELVKLIEAAEQPIKDGILVFDNKRREEKKVKAMELIDECVKDYGLDEKYASRLTVLDKYLNLNGSVKGVREDIELRGNMLKNEQGMEKAKAEMLKGTIETTLESANKTIKTPLKYEDFQRYIDLGWDAVRIIKEINDRAELIREAEKPKEESKPVEEIKPQVSIPVDIVAPIEIPVETKTYEPLYFVDIKVIHDKENISKLSQFLKDNGYEYIVNDKGRQK